jgi:hypothetical protein
MFTLYDSQCKALLLSYALFTFHPERNTLTSTVCCGFSNDVFEWSETSDRINTVISYNSFILQQWLGVTTTISSVTQRQEHFRNVNVLERVHLSLHNIFSLALRNEFPVSWKRQDAFSWTLSHRHWEPGALYHNSDPDRTNLKFTFPFSLYWYLSHSSVDPTAFLNARPEVDCRSNLQPLVRLSVYASL